VNVYLGIGIPWLAAAIYWAAASGVRSSEGLDTDLPFRGWLAGLKILFFGPILWAMIVLVVDGC
jgi:hypothetical protein